MSQLEVHQKQELKSCELVAIKAAAYAWSELLRAEEHRELDATSAAQSKPMHRGRNQHTLDNRRKFRRIATL